MDNVAPTALITGTSRGLGPEVARQLAARGFRVIATSRHLEPAQALIASLPGEHLAMPLDLADRASIEAVAGVLGVSGTQLDLLVNNAGIALKGFDADVARKTLDVNYYGTLDLTRALLPHMKDGSAITMVSSGMGELTVYGAELKRRFLDPELTIDGLAALVESFVAGVAAGEHEAAGWPSSGYRVSKAALNALTRIFARELAPRDIRVNAVCPGWVRTDLGGARATRDIPTGAASIVATALMPEGSGGFYRDGAPIPW